MRFLSVLLLVAAATGTLCPRFSAAQSTEEHSPRGALWRAAVVPGWGQLYNRQYYKVPIVYAGLGGLAVSAILVNRDYLLYRRSYLFLARRENGEPVFPEYEYDYHRLRRKLEQQGLRPESEMEPDEIAAQRARLEPQFRSTRNNLRRNRDLLYIGIGLFYGLTILDAYVNAHLLDFDVGEDLTLSLQPGPLGFTASVRIK